MLYEITAYNMLLKEGNGLNYIILSSIVEW